MSEREEGGWAAARAEMVDIVRRYGVKDPAVLRAMGTVRRHRFIAEAYRRYPHAYGDHPCAIGHSQTISQPFIVAHMIERMAIRPGEKILEIGTGSGYQAAVLAEVGGEVFSVEIVPELAEHARRTLKEEGYESVQVRCGNGYEGWPERQPYDAIVVSCAPWQIPEGLVEQLREGGRMILPVGEEFQRLVVLRKRAGGVVTESDLAVRFVPMVHERGSGSEGEQQVES